MATKVKFTTTIDETGRLVTLIDSSQWDTGVSARIDKITYTLSSYNATEILKAVQDSTNVNLPSITVILSGPPVLLNAVVFGNDELVAFSDGVLDINSYYRDNFDYELSAVKGDTYIETNLADELLDTYDFIEVSGKIYQLDRSKATNGGTILYVTTPFEDDSAEVYFGYRYNTKLLNSSETTFIYLELVGKLSRSCCGCTREDLFLIDTNLKAAEILMDKQVWDKANALLREANSIAKFKKGCSC